MTLARDGLPRGLIVKGVGGLYYVQGEDGQLHVLRAKGKFRKLNMTPLVGDRVAYTPDKGEEHGWLEEILPRDSVLVRPPVANVRTILVVIAPQPAPDYLLVDLLLAMAYEQGIEPALVVNKCDLDPDIAREAGEMYRGLKLPILPASAETGEGLGEVARVMAQGICCFAGQSGVGKSTLLGKITGLSLETGEISRKISRGRHTTRHVQLLSQGGFTVLDTPGFSLLEPWENLEPIRLKEFYPEFASYEGLCKFAPCYHFSEPGCAVLKAARDGELSGERLGRYHLLLQKIQKAWRERYE
ncbi:MAG: ribosome small subunit-dependent GTPase A [Candidatus Limiplasma sp.]|nr:ribosome small subunit-dependent GTPase A [Candidatus Limiplasma sp.]